MASSNYFATYAQDLEQDPFDPDDFVERLAWRLTGGGDTPIDPQTLHDAFEEEIANLQLLSEQYGARIKRLRDQCTEKEEEFYETLEMLKEENAKGFEKLKELDSNINEVATKVLQLGDQLQTENAPRAKAQEAFQLMQYFNEFLSDQPLESEVFHDPFRLLEAAQIIHKLSMVAQELPSKKFEQVQTRIQYQYEEIEKVLLEEFDKTQKMGHIHKMKQLADILSQFKGYNRCIDAFVEHAQVGEFRSTDIFTDILNLCKKTDVTVQAVFTNPEQVMAKLVLNIFHGKFQEFLSTKLGDPREDPNSYLKNLYELYSKTQKLSIDLAGQVKVGSDKNYVPALIRALFAKYIDPYMGTEKRHVKGHCSRELNRFYESKGHQKRSVQAGGIQGIGRDIQHRLMTPETFGGETFISETVAIGILQETKTAFARCAVLSAPGDTPANVLTVLDILLQSLIHDHLDYAVELAFNTIPGGSEPKAPPETHFLTVVRQTTAICSMFEKQFDDSILPLVKGSPQEEACVSKKRSALYALENKLSTGLDRLLTAGVNWVRVVLGEQKKTDFKPESEDAIVALCSNTCTTVVKYVNNLSDAIKDALDGQNLTATQTELGTRFHRALLDHIYQFTFNTSGSMLLLCDVNEYRKWGSSLKLSLINKLFETLHALCNLLVVVPDNLTDACTAELLGDVNRETVVSFIQLRADYKSAKLFHEFR